MALVSGRYHPSFGTVSLRFLVPKSRIDFHFNPLSFPAIFDPPRRHQLMRNPHDFSTGRPPPQKPKTQSSQSIYLLKNVDEQVNFMMPTAKKRP